MEKKRKYLTIDDIIHEIETSTKVPITKKYIQVIEVEGGYSVRAIRTDINEVEDFYIRTSLKFRTKKNINSISPL